MRLVKEENAERLETLKGYLTDEMANKKPCKEYVSDLQLSIERLKNAA
jgi:hypothetical protein